MSYQNLLYSKNGLSTKELAKIFLTIQEGEKIPTVTELNAIIGQARGTTQNAIKLLQNSQAILLEARGSLGTFLIKKDVKKLLDFSGINAI
ncbi:helix-turn-helix domain-containing protein, partial [Amedibacillus dolichus]|uniref:helix-turn-helix domain-containing protein n=1 Tax=Amedibacillus dolichus TaxID=31971 RepID=UPI00242C42E0